MSTRVESRRWSPVTVSPSTTRSSATEMFFMDPNTQQAVDKELAERRSRPPIGFSPRPKRKRARRKGAA